MGFGFALEDVHLSADRGKRNRAPEEFARLRAEATEQVVDDTAHLVGVRACSLLVVAVVQVTLVDGRATVVRVRFARVAGRRARVLEDRFRAVAGPATQSERRDLPPIWFIESSGS